MLVCTQHPARNRKSWMLLNRVLQWLAFFVFFASFWVEVKGCTPAPGPNVNEGESDCNFTESLCEWANNDDGLQWILVNTTTTLSNETRLFLPFPGDDEGYATLDYESSADYFKEREALLQSPKITGPKCMTFRFYLYGNKTGILTVQTKGVSQREKERIFRRYGNYGTSWHTAQLFINRTDEYTVTIHAEVGNHEARNVLAIDQVAFSNETDCEELPVEHLNCTMGQSFCQWKDRGSHAMVPTYDQGLARYIASIQGLVRKRPSIVPGHDSSKFDIRGPWLGPGKGCFRFQYRTKPQDDQEFDIGKLFLFVVNRNNEELPFWNQDIYHSIDWKIVEVEIDSSEETFQFLIQGLQINGYIYFRDFIFFPNSKNCQSTAERTFYISSPPSHPQNITISQRSGYCDSYPSWYFVASVVPTLLFPRPMFIYSIYNSLIFNDTRNDDLYGHLQRYFYVSDAKQNNSQPMFFSRKTSNPPFVIKFYPHWISSRNNSVAFIKEFTSIADTTDCQYGWTKLGGECYKLFCKIKFWSRARLECFKREADLASFAENLDLATSYLKRVGVHEGGLRGIAVGLEKVGHTWFWSNGKPYNASMASLVPRAGLLWDALSREWLMRGAGGLENGYIVEQNFAGFFCQKTRVNFAYLKTVKQSSTLSNYDSSVIVDVSLATCSYAVQNTGPSWWQVDLDEDVRIYKIKVLPSPDQDFSVHLNIAILGHSLQTLHEQSIMSVRNRPSEIFYEPAVITRFVKLETSQDFGLCELEIYATGLGSSSILRYSHHTPASRNYVLTIIFRSEFKDSPKDDVNKLRGVSWSFGDQFFGVISSFHRPDFYDNAFDETLESYLMVETSGNYSFTSSGNAAVQLAMSSNRDTIMSAVLQWKYDVAQKESAVQHLDSCKFYFLKIIKRLTSQFASEDYSLNIHSQNDSNGGSTVQFFWVLPGKLEVQFLLMESNESGAIVIGEPVTLEGVFLSHCNGLYCGSCPLVIVIHFAGYFNCTSRQNLTEAKKDSLQLKLENWVSYPRQFNISMGYQIGGNCSEIEKRLNSIVYTETSVIGQLSVNPIIVVTCSFALPNICDRDVMFQGWNQVDLADGTQGFAFESVHNTSSQLSLGWINDNSITRLTGLCLRFEFKMRYLTSNLSFVVETSSGIRKQIWSLSGYHGDQWNSAWRSLPLEEKHLFVFQVDQSNVNESVTIAKIRVTTEQCPTKISPYYALPGHSCRDKYRCNNGECISFLHRCNGDFDCVDKSDEANCACLKDQFQCETSSECIPAKQLCDDVNNCKDGSDERVCNLCGPVNDFYCPSGKCVHYNDTCNGLWDCPDGSDEPDVCTKSDGMTANKTCRLNNLGCLLELQTAEDCKYFQGNCDFENGFCGLFNMRTNVSFDWLINQGATPTSDTGPPVDHTTRTLTGSYIYMEASPPQLPGHVARLLGGPFQGGQSLCFQFYYHMFGEHVGRLNVYISRTTEQLLWNKEGNFGEQWQKALISVDSPQDFKIIVEAVRGAGHLGDIAIDDVIVKKGACTSQDHDELIASCSFDDDVCDWNITESWRQVSYDSGSSSLLQGTYIFNQAPFSLSKTVKGTMSYQCLSLWYGHSADCDSASLYFSQMTEDHRWTIKIVDMKNAETDDWKFAEIPLRPTSKDFTISLNATLKNLNKMCDIFLDEIKFSLETCMIIKEGRPVRARVGDYFQNGRETIAHDKTVTVFFENLQSVVYKVYEESNINQIVDPRKISEIRSGSRVIVEDDRLGHVVLASVIKDCSYEVMNISSTSCNFTVKLDENGENIAVHSSKIWPLPVQLEDNGPVWRNPVSNCESQNYLNGSCYKIIAEANWFDAVDHCKQYGGTFLLQASSDEGRQASSDEGRFITNRYNMSTFWVGMTFDNVEVLRNSSNMTDPSLTRREESFEARLFDGQCLLLRNGTLVEQRCSQHSQSVCKIPGYQRAIFCGRNDVSKIIKCKEHGTTLTIHSAIIGEDFDQLNECFKPLNVSKLQKFCGFPDHTTKIKIKCDGNTSCHLEGAFNTGVCPYNRVYFDVVYACDVSEGLHDQDVESTEEEYVHEAWCPSGYLSIEWNCYKIFETKKSWQDAQLVCELDKGSNLATVNDDAEENLLVSMAIALGVNEFWIGLNDLNYEDLYEWAGGNSNGYMNMKTSSYNEEKKNCVSVTNQGWVHTECDTKLPFVCEFLKSKVSCDFEHGWCEWRTRGPSMLSWTIEHVTSHKLPFSASNSSSAMLQLSSPVDLYTWDKNGGEVMILSTNIKYKMPAFTTCTWFNPTNTTRDAVLFTYGGNENLMVFFSSDSQLQITVQNITRAVDAVVSFETWQHVCFSLDTTMHLWRFFKNGFLIDTGISDTAVKDSSQIVVGGRMICDNNLMCSVDNTFVGEMAMPQMWLTMLDLHQVLMSSSGCSLVLTGNVPLGILKNVTNVSSYNQECRNGEGSWLTLLKDNVGRNSSSVQSPWMRSSTVTSRGVCLAFAFRLFGNETELNVAIQQQEREAEVLWKMASFLRTSEWQYGRVYLGRFLHFRVIFSGSLVEEESAIYIDNVFFETGMCASLPQHAQEWSTSLSINTTGFLSSPYYPSFYLNNMRRTWKLQAPFGQRIRLKILYLDLEDDPQCTKDILKFQDGGTEKLSVFCGKTLPAVFTSESEVVHVLFKTDSTNVHTGFKLQYDVVDANMATESCYFTDVPDCPTNCHCHRWPSNQTKITVIGKNLYRIPTRFPRRTSAIFFDKNFFLQLTTTDFIDVPQLEYLNLNENLIAIIDASALHHLSSLKSIQLVRNLLSEVPRNLFRGTTSLQALDLGGNRIQTLESSQFVFLKQLTTLSMRLNRLTELNEDVFAGLERLEFLYLDRNNIADIQDNVFKDLKELKVLSLEHNNLNILKRKWLETLTSLTTLTINDNNIQSIEPGSFDNLRQLVNLDLSQNHFQTIPESLFANLGSLRNLKVSTFMLCCFAEKSLPAVQCTSLENDGISSCDELLKNDVLKYAIWVLGVMALLGNLGVVLWRLFHKDKNRVNSFLLTNLAVADLLMGVYLIIIAYKNTVWFGVYFKHDVSWRSSNLCIITGVVSTISSEVSVLTLSLITFDRLICLVFPFRFQRMSMKRVLVVMSAVWLLGALIAVLPLFYDDYFYDYVDDVHFYGRSAVCLPFHLSSKKVPGWQYSSAIFLGLNGVSFMFIVVAYVIMYRTITKAGKSVRSTRMNQDSTLAKRMMLIILTDFFCWFPVIIISILALTGVLHDSNQEAYAWVAVFVLPINSSINPLLYTFSTVLAKKGTSSKSTVSKTFSEQSKNQGTKSTFNDASVSNKSSPLRAGGGKTKPPTQKGFTRPSVMHRHEMLNEAFEEELSENGRDDGVKTQKDKNSFILKPLQLVNSFGEESYSKINFLAFYEAEHSSSLCLVQVYDKTFVDRWESTKLVLSSIQNDTETNDGSNLIAYLWSATAGDIFIKKGASSDDLVVELEPGDCVICYGQPSNETLQDFLGQNSDCVTVYTVIVIARDILLALCHLASKNIVHNAILPQNIFISRDDIKSHCIKAYLGGLSAAHFNEASYRDKKEDTFDSLNDLRKVPNDLRLYGELLKTLIENCSKRCQFTELDEIANLCLAEETEMSLSAQEILTQVEAIDVVQDTSF